MIDEHAAHLASGEDHHMGAILNVNVLLQEDPDESFVDEGGGLERVSLAFGLEQVGGHAAERGVYQGEQAIQGVRLPDAGSVE